MYFHLLHHLYPKLTEFGSSFTFTVKEKNKNPDEIFIKLKSDEVSVYCYVENVENAVVKSKHDIITINFSGIEDFDYFLLNTLSISYQDSIFRKDKNRQQDNNNNNNNSFIKYGEYFPNPQIFQPSESENGVAPAELFFCIIEDLYDKQSDFNKYVPDFCESIRNTIEQSKVFEYINKKRLFYKSYYNYEKSGEQISDNNVYRQDIVKHYRIYKDLLLANNILQHIPADLLKSENWVLINPEEEIKNLSRINEEKKLDLESFDGIQNYLLQKHDVLTAMKIKMQNAFWIPVILQLISFFSFAGLLILWLFKNPVYNEILLISGIFSLIVSLLAIRFWQKNNNLFMPRLLIALVSSWLIIVGLTDYLKSLILINNSSSVFAVLAILSVLLVSIWQEVKQNSPYQKLWKANKFSSYKIIPIFVFAFNISFVLGILFHFFIINNYISQNNLLVDSGVCDVKTKLDSIKLIGEEIEKNTSNEKVNKYDSIVNFINKKEFITLEKIDTLKDSNNIKNILYKNNDSIFIKNIKLNNSFNEHINIKSINSEKNDKILTSFRSNFIPNDGLIKEILQPQNWYIIINMFIIHLFLSLAIAIVGQAIVSKDTITEPI